MTSLPSDQHSRLSEQFANEPAYQFVGIRLTTLAVGRCDTTTTVKPELLHHRGAVQGGIISMIADATAGYTALSVLPPDMVDSDMATIEFKTSYYRPAFAKQLICQSETNFAGGRIVFCRSRVYLDDVKPAFLCAESTLTFARLNPAR